MNKLENELKEIVDESNKNIQNVKYFGDWSISPNTKNFNKTQNLQTITSFNEVMTNQVSKSSNVEDYVKEFIETHGDKFGQKDFLQQSIEMDDDSELSLIAIAESISETSKESYSGSEM